MIQKQKTLQAFVLQGREKTIRFRPALAVFVTSTQHGRKGGHLFLAPSDLARLFKIPLGTCITDNAFSIKALF